MLLLLIDPLPVVEVELRSHRSTQPRSSGVCHILAFGKHLYNNFLQSFDHLFIESHGKTLLCIIQIVVIVNL